VPQPVCDAKLPEMCSDPGYDPGHSILMTTFVEAILTLTFVRLLFRLMVKGGRFAIPCRRAQAA
jgi:hypothetical protein